jgi:sec-independent protein translocase protein TatC
VSGRPEELSPPQTLIDHLEELRKRLIRAFIAIFIGMGIAWSQTDRIMDWIRQPIAPYLPEGGLIFTGVMDKFMAHIKVAAMSGVILSCPFWIYQLYKFVAPGLYKHERRYAMFFILFGSTLFLSGVAFVYFLVYPAAFHFLMTFGGATDKPMISIAEYLGFFTMTTMMFGLAFELPLILTLMAMLGVIDSAFLKAKRRYAVVLLAVVSAILTPPDLISMLMMMVPMVFLYESAIWIVYFFVEKPRERLAQTAPETAKP